mmetsp:Transcript_13289/g.33689  ORF Transcript_13289/g.33689 Transcript_13289/m.33689 type:complete len:1169 (-) Transcript_13289:1916-5422(-)
MIQERFAIFEYNILILDVSRDFLASIVSGPVGFRWILDCIEKCIPQRDDCSNAHHLSAMLTAKKYLYIFELETLGHWGQRFCNAEDATPPSNLDIAEKLEAVCDELFALKEQSSSSAPDYIRKSPMLNPETVYCHCLASEFMFRMKLSPIGGSGLLNIPVAVDITDKIENWRLTLLEIYGPLADNCLTKSKVAFCLAYIARYVSHDFSLAEKLFLDALQALCNTRSYIVEFFESFYVGSSFAVELLKEFGSCLLHNSKYCYGLACFHAMMDAQCVVDRKRLYLMANEVSSNALQGSDWFSALTILYDIRFMVNPKDGRRNEFLVYCMKLSSVCSSVGLFGAAIVPLHACFVMMAGEQKQLLFKNQERRKQKFRRGDFLHKIVPRAYAHIFVKQPGYLSAQPVTNESEDVSLSLDNTNGVLESDRFLIHYMRIRILMELGWYALADNQLLKLLENSLPPGTSVLVYDIIARLKFRRGEVAHCIEFCEKLSDCLSGNRAGDSNPEAVGDSVPEMITDATFLKIRALMHGERFGEALLFVHDCSNVVPEAQLKNRARLLYYRGRILSWICSFTNPADYKALLGTSYAKFLSKLKDGDYSRPCHELDGELAAAALMDFEFSSSYYISIGDEIRAAKADGLWISVCLDWLFRQVVIEAKELSDSLRLNAQNLINPDTLQSTIMSLLNFAGRNNMRVQLMTTMVLYAEWLLIKKEPSKVWGKWLDDALTIFNQLFTNQDQSIMLVPVAPVSFLIRLKKLVGRMVRLVFFQAELNEKALEKRVQIFETYTSLCTDIDRRLNLANPVFFNNAAPPDQREMDEMAKDEGGDMELISVFANLGLGLLGRNGLRYVLHEPVSLVRGRIALFAATLNFEQPFNLKRFKTPEEMDEMDKGMKILDDPANALAAIMQSSGDLNQDERFEAGLRPFEKVWVCMHRLKMERKRYSAGLMTLEELSVRNESIFRSWAQIGGPPSMRPFKVPDVLKSGVLYALHVPGMFGYFFLDANPFAQIIPFGGKYAIDPEKGMGTDHLAIWSYLFELVGSEKRGLVTPTLRVFEQLREFLCVPAIERRKIIVVCDSSLRSIPWELLLNCTVFRCPRLHDVIRSTYKNSLAKSRGDNMWSFRGIGADVLSFVAFVTESEDETQLEVEEARKERLAFNSIYRLNISSSDLLKER